MKSNINTRILWTLEYDNFGEKFYYKMFLVMLIRILEVEGEYYLVSLLLYWNGS